MSFDGLRKELWNVGDWFPRNRLWRLSMTLNIGRLNFVVFKGGILECKKNINIRLYRNFPGWEIRTNFGDRLGILQVNVTLFGIEALISL